MNKPGAGLFFDIRRHSIHDGPGIRTAFFMKGCPLACRWCHNPESLDFKPELQRRPERCIKCGSCGELSSDADACPTGALETIGRELTVAEALKQALADEPFYDASGGGVTFTGGEPLAQGAFLLEAVREFKNYSIGICLDTSGYAPDGLVREIAPFLDLVLYDIKHMDDATHQRLTGVSNRRILSNARLFATLGTPMQISFPLIPGLTDDAENLEATAHFVSELAGLSKRDESRASVRILPYHGSARPKYERKGLKYLCSDQTVPSSGDCGRAASYFQNYGLTTSIGGL